MGPDEALDLVAGLPAGSLTKSALRAIAAEEAGRAAARRARAAKRRIQATEWAEV